MKIIAHRGASFDAPENTLAAIRLAWQQRADAVEIDVHLSRDHHLVVIHDFNTRKTAGRNRPVARQTLARLRTLDAGQWKHPRWRGEKIPTLEEVLATVPHGKRLFIEIKTRADATNTLARVFQIPSPPLGAKVPEGRMRGRRPDIQNASTPPPCHPSQITLIGFSFAAMKKLKHAFPQIEVCWVTTLKRHWLTRRYPDAAKLIKKVRAANLDGFDLCANAAVTAALIKKIQTAGLKVYVWTVDTPAIAKKFALAGLDGLTTNRPAEIRAATAAVL